jgi:hypothetical protein
VTDWLACRSEQFRRSVRYVVIDPAACAGRKLSHWP